MTTALKGRTGRYLHDPAWKVEKRFASPGATDRSFSVLIAAAESAGGLTGSEYNGIAVLDNDNAGVVLDRHAREGSGYHGPSPSQIEEFRRIGEMDWGAFSSFCASNPRFRSEVAPDMARRQESPDEGSRLMQLSLGIVKPEKGDIRTPLMRLADADPDCPYRFPAMGREEMIQSLVSHPVYRGGHYQPYRLSWNIKLTMDYDSDGMTGDQRCDPAFTQKWRQRFEKDPTLFEQACEDLLRPYLDGQFTPWPGPLASAGNDASPDRHDALAMEEGRFHFATDGKSGGYLVLTRFDGEDLAFSDMIDFASALDAMDDKAIAELTMAVRTLDRDLERPRIARAFEEELNFLRRQCEEEWAAPESRPEMAG